MFSALKNLYKLMLRLPKYKYYFAATNLLVFSISFTIIVNLFFPLNQHQEPSKIFFILSLILPVFLLAFVFINKSSKLYKLNIFRTKSILLFLMLKITGYTALIGIVIALIFFSNRFADQVLIFISFSLSTFILFIIFRIKTVRDFFLKVSEGKHEKNLLIVGSGKSGKKLTEKVITENKLGIKIKGLIKDEVVNQNVLDGIFKEEIIDEIFISIDNKSYEDLMNIIDLCGKYNIDVKLSSDLFGIISQKIQTEKYYDIPVIDITPHFKGVLYFKFKRILDVLLSLTGLIFLTPIFLVIMISIKVSSKGPIFYKQKRVGLNGKLFDLYKFRSMYIENGEDKKREDLMIDFMKNNKTQKIIDVTRVTQVGKFIRRTSLDELPQLYNVIKGNMSIVGPRPCLPYEFNNYADWQKRRVKVLPGCTGVWQISGRSSVSFIDSIVLDLFYINNMSPLYDINLILKTIPVMFFSRGGE